MGYTASETEMMFRKVIKDVASGASVRSACKKDGTPSLDTFYKWLEKDKSKAERYARATEKRAEAIFEDILNIADENYKDTYVDGEGIERTDYDVIQRSKLRVDSRKWVLAKMMPKRYGDKLDVTSDGQALAVPAIIGMTIKNEITSTADEPSDDDLN
jgi:hypothetical protein